MKKLFAGITLAAVIVSGVFFAVNSDPIETTWGERHPPIVKSPWNLDSDY
ncbi:hypothetical protein M3210_03945 [Oceanobacillus luteolus]|uniref:Phr family secreted Rap phosphatase inhibitor n=1 Tax=Oceanobacillus luteolus TaxID=1274358 RepID=A0ABW4HNQ2_9BACI|nr:hypothetical protein [Oceanobacillus luteolus]MCM3739417.1 hypothetical protein [Oceanobacillus luteolus]